MQNRRSRRIGSLAACLVLLSGLVLPSVSQAATAEEINASADAAIATFEAQYKGGAEFLAQAPGVLIFPNVIKAAFVFGAQYGEGVLREQGNNVAYYSYAGGSWGLSIGVQEKDIILVFRDPTALAQFEKSSGWRAGIDGSITLITAAVGTDLSTMQINQPIVAFVVGQKGLMGDVSLTGSKISKIKR